MKVIWPSDLVLSLCISVSHEEIMDEKLSHKEFMDHKETWAVDERDLCFDPQAVLKPMEATGTAVLPNTIIEIHFGLRLDVAKHWRVSLAGSACSSHAHFLTSLLRSGSQYFKNPPRLGQQ